MNYFETRRTIRHYSNAEISDAEIDLMLSQAMHAPTCGAMQLYSVVISRTDAEKAALAPAHFNQPCLLEASAVLTFCADFNRFTEWCKLRGANPGFDNVQSFISAALDATILAQQFVTIAEMKGYGTCYLGTTTWNAPRIIDALGLPSLVVPIITVTLGVPAENPPVQPRLPIDSFIHRGTYTPNTPERIESIYADFEQLPQNQAYVAENSKQNLAQVFTDIRYPKDGNEYFSKIFKEMLIKSGFNS